MFRNETPKTCKIVIVAGDRRTAIVLSPGESIGLSLVTFFEKDGEESSVLVNDAGVHINGARAGARRNGKTIVRFVDPSVTMEVTFA